MRRIAVVLVSLLVCACVTEEGWKPTHAPLQVTIVGSVTDAQLEAVMQGADRWRAELGREVVLVRVAESAQARCGQVDLSFAPLSGLTNGTTTRRACRASIQLRPDLTPAYMAVVVAHELGHALGLDHEQDEASLMYTSAPRDGGIISEDDLSYVESLLE